MYSPSDRAVAWTYTGGSFYIAVLHKLQDKTYQDMLQMPSEGNYRIFECVPGPRRRLHRAGRGARGRPRAAGARALAWRHA